MAIFQPTLHPPPEKPTLEGKTVIITGSNAGIGLETARQLLVRRASTVVLAVRNTGKGELAKAGLLADPAVRHQNPTGVVIVMELDMDDYGSVSRFAAAVTAALPALHILILNAGLGTTSFERSASTGHERTLQVNYLSNVHLLLSLLPLLRATSAAAGDGALTRVAWNGSRAHAARPSNGGPGSGGLPLLSWPMLVGPPGSTVLGRLDQADTFAPLLRYPDTKLLAALFLRELAARCPSPADPRLGGVVVTMFCPGMVNTAITDSLPWYARLPMNVAKALFARTVEQAGWVAVNAAVMAGPEAHGRYLRDMEFFEETDFMRSADGRKLREMVWKETMAEMEKLTLEVPAWMKD